MTQAFLDLWMSQSSQGETQFINRDLSEKMLISEIESKNHGFVDIMVALQRCYTPSRLPPIQVTQPQCKLGWSRVYQEVLIEDRKVSVGLWMRQSSQGETQFINTDLSEKMLISEIKTKNVGFVDIMAAFQRVCAPSKVTHHRGYPSSRLPTIKFAPHPGHPASVQIG